MYNTAMKTKAMRIIERKIYAWPKVRHEDKFDARWYYANNISFAFIYKNDLILTRITQQERTELVEKWGAGPCTFFSRPTTSFLQMPLTAENAGQLLPYIQSSYKHSLTWRGV